MLVSTAGKAAMEERLVARLQGKVAIITGAAKGLGEADARMFVREGATVVLCDVDEAGVQCLADELGEGAEAYLLDVTQEKPWQDLIAHVKIKYGRLDILVNNAGVVAPGNIETQTEDDYRFQMAVSADGTFFGSKHAIPLMAASGGGSIVNMGSLAAVQGERYVLGYSAAKGAITAMTRSIAVHCALEKNGVRCNSVCPSGIVTPMVMSMGQKMADAGLSMGTGAAGASKLGEPNDIAAVVTFLASDESRFVNGATINVDQGMSIISGVVPE
jgi:3(or 17)beta-hydroxysteroid dehydrogenase